MGVHYTQVNMVLFECEYPLEAKTSLLVFLQEYLLNDFFNNRPSNYATSLLKNETATMQMTAN